MTAEEVADLRLRRYNATVVSLNLLNPDLMVLRVRPDFPRHPHHPGQYCTLGLGYWEPRVAGCQEETLPAGDETKVVRRAYSLSCSIYSEPGRLMRLEENDWFEFYIVLVRENPDGRVPALTPRLFALKKGDRIQVGERVTGHYTLDPVKDGDTVIFLGTGTGEAPHNYMTWELLGRGHTGKILNVCCVRYARDLGYRDTHTALMEQFPNYTYLPLTTREPGVTRKVYIQDLIASGELEERLGGTLDPARTHVFLCGNPKMIGVPHRDRDTGAMSYPQPVGAVEVLEARGFKADVAAIKLKGNVHFEEYW
ncbi:MAG: ferredoxin--NADP reductase [Planctomycetes bacterium]|nr:ferredoxin--NADP reductase [Planctomycetota bacterium]